MLTLAQAQALLPGATLVGDGSTAVERVHTDSRSLRTGDLFVALRGERFDAHDFLAQARSAGAVAAIAERGLAEAALPGLLVPDSLRALQALAAGWRAALQLPVIAVTGSNGKTTVTQMIAAILRTWQGDAAWATAGNLNNHIGVPLTVLGLRAAHRVAVIELGMNHPGEIAELARIAQPTVALINNAQREHQEFMKSVAAVARENGAVLAALPANGVAVFPADDEHTPLWQALAEPRITLCFSLDVPADLTAEAQWQGDHWAVELHTPAGGATLQLRVAGRHNVKNALAAAACALAAGCPLWAVRDGLNSFAPVQGRSQVQRLHWRGHDITLVNDSYNANPDSVRAAIDVLAGLPGPRWLLLGDMGEVGDQGPAFHEEVGRYALERGIDHLWLAGPLATHAAGAYGPAALWRADAAALVAALAEAPDALSVLVKGSRFMKMEQLVAALLSAGESSQAEVPHAH
ncbi:MAG: UDP-N-acetylmuramoyl-tripeptide--D-alanyl-D-alanine ligase [Burkholderiales bacterium]